MSLRNVGRTGITTAIVTALAGLTSATALGQTTLSGEVLAPSDSSHYEFLILTADMNVNGATVTATATWASDWYLPPPIQHTASAPNLVEVPYLGGFGCDFIRNYPQNNFVEFQAGMDPTNPNATKTGSITVGPGKAVAIAGSDCFFGDNFTFHTLVKWTVQLGGCQAKATAVKMFDSHTLQVDVSGQFSNNPLSPKILSLMTSIGGVPLSSVFPLPSGSTGTQSQSLFIDLAANGVPRFTDNARFQVTAGMTDAGAACMGTAQDAVVLLPVIIIPGIQVLTQINGGDGTFPVLEAFLKNVFAAAPFLGQPYRLRSDMTGYPTLYTLNYRTALASFLEGASDLNALISQVKSLTYADAVNILTHSKGGLVARQFLAGGISGPGPIPVKRFIMCEPPNLGSLEASWDSLLVQLGLPSIHADLRNLLPVWPWERPLSFLPFRSTPNPELDGLNNEAMPVGISYTLIYSTSQDTHWTRTGLPAAFFFSDVPGDGIVPAFSMFGLKPDPNNPGQTPILIPAFQGITINAIEIDGPHSGYLEQPTVMSRVGALLTQ